MNGEWCYFKSYLSKKTCNEIVELANKIPSQDAVLGLNSNPILSTESRRSKIRFVNQSHWELQHVFDTLWKTAITANHDFFNFHISKLDFFQVAEYDSSYKGEYKRHHDVFWMNEDPKYHRKLSCIIQLTDPSEYEGGEFELHNVGSQPLASDIKQQGTIIFFPSFIEHQAHPVTKGTRRSIAAWFDGPKWR